MTLADDFSSTPQRQGGDERNPRLGENRSFDTFMRAPSMAVPMPGKKRPELHTDRVRAAPAVTPTVSGAIGNTAILLGFAGMFFPKQVAGALGIKTPAPVVQALFGARELWSGYSLAGDPTKSEVLWARVAGDVFDIAVLSTLNRADNPKQANARAALGFVLAVTALDVVTAVRMTNVKRNCE